MWFQLFGAAALFAVIFAVLPRRNKRFPPGPVAWPIIGCLPSVGFRYRQKTFFNLSKKYGPIMYIQLGGADVILVHSPELAMEALGTQDPQFCSRRVSTDSDHSAVHCHIDSLPCNAQWKLMRKTLQTGLMSTSRLNVQAKMREEEMMAMAARVLDCIINQGQLVNMKVVADDVALNMLLQMLFGKRYKTSDSNVAKELRNIGPYLREAMILVGNLNIVSLSGEPNIADLVPSLARFDLQGFVGRYFKLIEKVKKLVEIIIDEHKHALEQSGTQMSEESKDFIYVLLSQKGENKVTTMEITGIMIDVLFGGLGPTTIAIEWAIAEMVANPHTLLKAQLELDNIVGKQRLLEESDIEKLPYLRAVVKETLRLHPPEPLTNPHFNEAPATLAGYNLPPGCMVFVNIWGLGRDPSVWKNPLQFNPDRFIGSDFDVHGNHYQLLPFSSGRRRCPASHFATLKVQHVLGILLQCFEWAPPAGVSAEEMDLTEGAGVVSGLKKALLVSAKPRVDPSLYTSRC